ncbi:hypothetical protein ACFSSA_00780 [Luteolibacter algae]|uniref:Lipoprotein n=1 Tax=Luteolibacter algae TaxID=454151 RepID=A0ABW5D5B2_9BACT
MKRILRNTLSASAILLIAAACQPDKSARYLRQTTSAANDNIMLVRENPPTFGQRRLDALASYYPDLGVFLAQQGHPDFLAETNKGENRYLIIYYLNARKAFACRSGIGRSHEVEFSGPYPITDNEAKTLAKLRDKASIAVRP